MKKELILASGSPRRKEILTDMGFALTVKTKEVDESLPIGTSPYDGVRLLAIKKGAAVVSEIGDAIPVLSADTLVELDGEPLGKPVDAADFLLSRDRCITCIPVFAFIIKENAMLKRIPPPCIFAPSQRRRSGFTWQAARLWIRQGRTAFRARQGRSFRGSRGISIRSSASAAVL